jgi:hypothetical protein
MLFVEPEEESCQKASVILPEYYNRMHDKFVLFQTSFLRGRISQRAPREEVIDRRNNVGS